MLFTGTDASSYVDQEPTKVSRELYCFDPLEVISASPAHEPGIHVFVPLTRDADGKVRDCPCMAERTGRLDIKQLTSHLHFLTTRSCSDDIQPRRAKLPQN